MEQKEIRIGTKTLAFVVGYSEGEAVIPENQDPEIKIKARRGEYSPEEAQRLNPTWSEEEIDIASKAIATELTSKGITPSRVLPLMDDRYKELTPIQMENFRNYCKRTR